MLSFLQATANEIGILGVIVVLYAYMMLQLGRMPANGFTYSLLNTIGSVLILISLAVYWNLASFLIEIAWLFISFYGLINAYILRIRKRNH